jgi:hypothetical protein
MRFDIVLRALVTFVAAFDPPMIGGEFIESEPEFSTISSRGVDWKGPQAEAM